MYAREFYSHEFHFFLLIAASSILGGYYSAPKNLNCIEVLSLFKICSHIFMFFEVKLE